MPVAPITAASEGQALLRRRDLTLLYNDQGEMVRDRLEAFRLRDVERVHHRPNAPGDPALPDLTQMLAWDEEFDGVLPEIALALPRERPGIRERCAERWNIYDTSTPAGEARFLLYVAIFPDAGPQADFADNLALHLAATRIMLAIELYRGRHGAPPPSLAALAPGILPEAPDDPYTLAPLIYRLSPDAPLGYTLYSTGYDGEDNGGLPWPEHDHPYKALGQWGDGFDYVFVGAAAPSDAETR